MQNTTSVLRDRLFVQTAGAPAMQFKSSVARKMQLGTQGPDAEHHNVARDSI